MDDGRDSRGRGDGYGSHADPKALVSTVIDLAYETADCHPFSAKEWKTIHSWRLHLLRASS